MSNKELEAIIAKLNKDFGKGTIMKLGESPKQAIEAISTGSIRLNRALGVGGYPKGRIVEIYGPESSGKTTLAIHAVVEEQRNGGRCAYIDMEHAFDAGYAASVGADVDELYFSQPGSGEEALQIVDELSKSGQFSLIVLDSVAALVPQKELDGEMGDSSIGLQARLMSQAMRKLVTIVNSNNVCLIMINQLREKIGVMFGSPEVTTGGNALKFYASIRLDIRKVTTNKEGDESVSNKVRVKVVKNKVAPPFKQAEFNIEFGEGIDSFTEIMEEAIDRNIIEKGGSWLTYNGHKVQGFPAMKQILKDNPEMFEEIKLKIVGEKDKIEEIINGI
jgi:recombination protein RecA